MVTKTGAKGRFVVVDVSSLSIQAFFFILTVKIGERMRTLLYLASTRDFSDADSIYILFKAAHYWWDGKFIHGIFSGASCQQKAKRVWPSPTLLFTMYNAFTIDKSESWHVNAMKRLKDMPIVDMNHTKYCFFGCALPTVVWLGI